MSVAMRISPTGKQSLSVAVQFFMCLVKFAFLLLFDNNGCSILIFHQVGIIIAFICCGQNQIFFSFFWLHITRIVEVELIFFQFLQLQGFFLWQFFCHSLQKSGGLQTVQRIYLGKKGQSYHILMKKKGSIHHVQTIGSCLWPVYIQWGLKYLKHFPLIIKLI